MKMRYGCHASDFGSKPFVVDIEKITTTNNDFRTAVWTGTNLQLMVMSIQPGDDIGIEIHHDVDQMLCIQQGRGLVEMGKDKDNLSFLQPVFENSAIFIPAGTWHNLLNTGEIPMKLYSIYAPPNHPMGGVCQ